MGRDSLPFRQYTVNLKGYDTPTPTYVGSFADLNTLLQIRLRVDDTLY
jgi:adenylate cyclase